MAREFARMQEFYLPLHELQPVQHYHHHYELHQPSASTAPAAYELTAGASGSVCAEAAGAHAHTPHATLMQQRRSTHCSSEMSNLETMVGAPHPSLNTPGSATWNRATSPTFTEPECELPAGESSLGAPQTPLNAPALVTRRGRLISSYSDNCEMPVGESSQGAPQTPLNAPALVTRRGRLISSYSSDNCEMPVGESSLGAPQTPLNAPALVTRRRRQISSYSSDNCEMPVMKTSPQTPQTPLNESAHATRRRRLSSYSSENYEMAGCETPLGAPQPPLSTTNSSSRKRRLSTYSSENYEMAGCETPLGTPQPSQSTPNSSSRKKRLSTYGSSSTFDDDGGDDSRSTRSLPDKKQNHSEIEKRRRDKMNTYITELSSMIPMCGAMGRKLDKLTVLRMAVQYIRSVHGAQSASPLSARPRPSFLSEPELNQLILDAAHDCFVLVVGCDRGRLLYVSASVKQMLHYEQGELLGQSLFDILHPKDVAKVKEQLSSSDLSPRERLIDAKTMLPVRADVQAGTSRLCPGARRSFFCRIKCKASPEAVAEPTPVKDDPEPPAKLRKKSNEKKYCVVQCTGYLKSWLPAETSEAGPSESVEEGDAGSLSCLVGVARALPDLRPAPAPGSRANPLQFIARHATDSKFLFVDQRVTLALGFLPQELIGTSLYEYVSVPDLGAVARAHKATLENCEPVQTLPYSFRRKDGTLVRLHTHFKPFKNPWTKEVEGLVANNTILSEEHDSSQEASQEYDLYRQSVDVEMQQLIESQVESHKIGSAIAEEALRRASNEYSTDLSDLLQDSIFNQTQPSLVDNILGEEAAGYTQVRNNVPLSVAAPGSPPAPGVIAGSPPAPEEQAGSPPAPVELTGTPSPVSPLLPPLGLDGNGEAAMAVIMSLLEADAGLGGPVNFSGLPWPLP